jgi:hypothetical protein
MRTDFGRPVNGSHATDSVSDMECTMVISQSSCSLAGLSVRGTAIRREHPFDYEGTLVEQMFDVKRSRPHPEAPL